MDCNKANELMMDYMDFNLSDEDRFLLEHHLKECKTCKEEFEIYSNMLEEFSVVEDIHLPEDFEVQVMEKIEAIEPKYLKQKKDNNNLIYVFIGFMALSISIFNILSYNKDIILQNIQDMPIFYKYYIVFENIFNLNLSDLSSDKFRELINLLLLYFVEGIKYSSIFVILGLVFAQCINKIKAKS